MLIDQELVMSDAQAITATAASTNVIDMKTPYSGAGHPNELFAVVGTAFTLLTSLGFQVQSSVDAAFTSPVNHQLVTVALANLTAGKVVDLGTVPDTALQYLRVNYVVTGTNPGAGTVTTALAPFGKPTAPSLLAAG